MKKLTPLVSGEFLATVPARRHMHLEGHCVLTRLIRHGYYHLPDWTAVREIYTDLRETITKNPASVPYDTLVIENRGTMLSIPVDMRNTQFIAADCSPGVYPVAYEPDVLTMMDVLLGDDDTFIDVGANWGYMTLHALLRPNFRGRVVAIEPAAGPRADLKRLVKACGFDERVDVVAFALSNYSRAVRMSRPMWSGKATIVNATEGEWVYARALDELGLPAASLIKVDIEGSETAFLRGARSYLERCEPAIIFECRTDSPGDDWMGPFSVLDTVGYRSFGILFEEHDRTTGVFRAVLRPVTHANRADFPVHLNVLAIRNIERLVTRSE